jgi:hypothetical protein
MDLSNGKIVVAAMGGPVKASIKLSEVMGRRIPVSTVGRWHTKGKLPLLWQDTIRMKASELGLQIEQP